MVFDFVWCDVVVDAAAGGHPLRRGHGGRGSLGALVVVGEASSNSRRLSATSATSLAEMLVFMTPLATHGSYGASRTLTASVVRATCAGPRHAPLSV